jgi:hypothetical protein
MMLWSRRQSEAAPAALGPTNFSLLLLPLPLGEGWGEGLSVWSHQLRPSSPALLPEGEGRYQSMRNP